MALKPKVKKKMSGAHFILLQSYSVGPGETRARDRDGIKRIQAVLQALPDIANVIVEGDDDPGESVHYGAQLGIYAKLMSVRPQTISNANPKRKLRICNYELRLVARGNNDDDAYEILDRLDSVVHDALDGNDLGFCVPYMSELSDARYDTTKTPDLILVMAGKFAYNVNLLTGYDEQP